MPGFFLVDACNGFQLLMWVVICFNFDGIRNVLLNHTEKLCMGPVYKREVSLTIQQYSTWQCYNSMEVNIQHLVFETEMGDYLCVCSKIRERLLVYCIVLFDWFNWKC